MLGDCFKQLARISDVAVQSQEQVWEELQKKVKELFEAESKSLMCLVSQRIEEEQQKAALSRKAEIEEAVRTVLSNAGEVGKLQPPAEHTLASALVVDAGQSQPSLAPADSSSSLLDKDYREKAVTPPQSDAPAKAASEFEELDGESPHVRETTPVEVAPGTPTAPASPKATTKGRLQASFGSGLASPIREESTPVFGSPFEKSPFEALAEKPMLQL
ncbi:unnamed protein product, partial [Polarella glacialis]